MTEQEVKGVLIRGGVVSYGLWTFSNKYMSCSEGCCDEVYRNFEAAWEDVRFYVGRDWKNVEEE